MKKILLGIAFVMFGILLSVIGLEGGIWLPVIGSLPWDLLGLIFGIAGLSIVIRNSRL